MELLMTRRFAVEEDNYWLLRWSLFWCVMQRRLAVICGRFGKTYRSRLQAIKKTW